MDVSNLVTIAGSVVTTAATMLALLGLVRRWVRKWIQSAATEALGTRLDRLTAAVESLELSGNATARRMSEHALRLDALSRRVDELQLDRPARRWS